MRVSKNTDFLQKRTNIKGFPAHFAESRHKAFLLFLRRADAIFLSREDVGGDDGTIAELAGRCRLLLVTDGYHGATIYTQGQATLIPPRRAAEVDPTGAGDVFATSFMVRYAETGDPFAAARFANIVASMSVEALGMEEIPHRSQVEAWMAAEAAGSLQ